MAQAQGMARITDRIGVMMISNKALFDGSRIFKPHDNADFDKGQKTDIRKEAL
jgi:hypothetical protein